MSKHDQFEVFAELYALGALGDGDRRDFESHLASGCEICEASLPEAREVADALPMVLAPMVPPETVKTQLLQRVRDDRRAAAIERGKMQSTPKSARASGSSWAWKLAAAAGLVSSVGAGLYALSLLRVVDNERLARQRSEEEAANLRTLVETFTSPRNQAVSLVGQDAAPQARATAFVDASAGRLYLYVENLPSLPSDQTYQIWVIADGDPVSVGLFDVAADGTARMDSQPLPSVQGSVTVAITVEPAGGVPQPTGAMVLVGT